MLFDSDDPDNLIVPVYNPETNELRDATRDQADRLKQAGFPTGADAKIAFYSKGTAGQVAAAVSGGAGGATLGATDALTQLWPGNAKKFINAANAANPITHLAGEVGGGLWGFGKLNALAEARNAGKLAKMALNVVASGTQGAIEAVADDARQGNDVNVEHITSGGIVGGLFGIGGEVVGAGVARLGKVAKGSGDALIALAKNRGWIEADEKATSALAKKAYRTAKGSFLENRAAEKDLASVVADAEMAAGPNPAAKRAPRNTQEMVDDLWEKMRGANEELDASIQARKSEARRRGIPDAMGEEMPRQPPAPSPRPEGLADEEALAKLKGFPHQASAAKKAAWFDAQVAHLNGALKSDPEEVLSALDAFPSSKSRETKAAWFDLRKKELERGIDANLPTAADEPEVFRRKLLRKMPAGFFWQTDEGAALKEVRRHKKLGIPASVTDFGVKDWRVDYDKPLSGLAHSFSDEAKQALLGDNPFLKAAPKKIAKNVPPLEGLGEDEKKLFLENANPFNDEAFARKQAVKATDAEAFKNYQAQRAAEEDAAKSVQANYREQDVAHNERMKVRAKADEQWEKSGKKLDKQQARIRDENALEDIFNKIKKNTPTQYQPKMKEDPGLLGGLTGAGVVAGLGYGSGTLAKKAGYEVIGNALRTTGQIGAAVRSLKYVAGTAQRSLADAANNEATRNAYFHSQLNPMLARKGKLLSNFLRATGGAAISHKLTNGQIDKAYDKLSANAERLQTSPELIEQHVAERLGPLTKENTRLHTAYVAKTAMAVKAVADAMPKNPLPPSAHNPPYNPPRSKKLEALQAYQAVNDPVGTLLGDPTPAQVERVKQVYPAIYKDVQTQLLSVVQDGKTQKLPRGKQARLSRILGGPLRPIDNRQYQMRAQSTFAPPPQGPQQQQQGQAQFSPRALSTIGKTGARVLAPGAQQSEVENAT